MIISLLELIMVCEANQPIRNSSESCPSLLWIVYNLRLFTNNNKMRSFSYFLDSWYLEAITVTL